MSCLEAIQRHPGGVGGHWMRCGSAILRWGFAGLSASRFVAADNDILAVRTAAENAALSLQMPAGGALHRLWQQYGSQSHPYDLIFANIRQGHSAGWRVTSLPRWRQAGG